MSQAQKTYDAYIENITQGEIDVLEQPLTIKLSPTGQFNADVYAILDKNGNKLADGVDRRLVAFLDRASRWALATRNVEDEMVLDEDGEPLGYRTEAISQRTELADEEDVVTQVVRDEDGEILSVTLLDVVSGDVVFEYTAPEQIEHINDLLAEAAEEDEDVLLLDDFEDSVDFDDEDDEFEDEDE